MTVTLIRWFNALLHRGPDYNLPSQAERDTQARLNAVLVHAQELVDGWKQASEEHAKFAESKVMDQYPGLADKQEGRSLQLLDCADELALILAGEDPSDWGHGIGLDVIDREERTVEQEPRP